MTDHHLPDLPPERIHAIAQQHTQQQTPRPRPGPRPSRKSRVVPWVGAACVIMLAVGLFWALHIASDADRHARDAETGQTALGQALGQANHRLKRLGGRPVTTPTAIVGAQGSPGPAGPSGQSGANGSNGSPGPRGKAGKTGKAGSSGEAGRNGSDGQNGAQGPVGASGAEGPSGPPGPSGPAGPQGSTGPQGPKGDKGESGSTGDPGDPPQSWTFTVPTLTGVITYTCIRDAPFDPTAPTYSCTHD